MASNVIGKIADAVEKLCEENGAYLYDIEMLKEAKTQVLRIYIDTESGIDIDECERISRLISDELDKTDYVKGAYNLEVSSPGVERKLKTLKHYEMALGKMIDVTLYAPLDGEKNFIGELTYADKDKILLIVNGKEMAFEKNKISLSKIYFDINEFLKDK